MAMSQEHKDALAQGRKEARAIKAYLRALEARKPGRPVTRESLRARLARVNQKIEQSDDPLKQVELVQNRLDVEQALASFEEAENLDALEAEFVLFAKGYSDRKGISYSAWREIGVPAVTLKRAEIAETRRR